MVLAPASRCMAAAPNLDPRNAAGVGINSGNLGLSLKDIGGETPVEPLEEKKEPARMGQKPQAGSKAAGLAIFQDDNLGYRPAGILRRPHPRPRCYNLFAFTKL